MHAALERRGLKSYEDRETSNSSKNGEQEQQQLEGEEPFFKKFKTRLGFSKNGTSDKRVSDYIMYSAHRGAKIVSRVEPQQNGFGEEVVGLPSKTQPSDHLCLRSRVSFEHPIDETPTEAVALRRSKLIKREREKERF